MSPNKKMPPTNNSRGNSPSLSKLKAAKEAHTWNKEVNAYELVVSLSLFSASNAIIK